MAAHDPVPVLRDAGTLIHAGRLAQCPRWHDTSKHRVALSSHSHPDVFNLLFPHQRDTCAEASASLAPPGLAIALPIPRPLLISNFSPFDRYFQYVFQDTTERDEGLQPPCIGAVLRPEVTPLF